MSKKLSKSGSTDRIEATRALREMLYVLADGGLQLELDDAVAAVVGSDWLREREQCAFWAGVNELAELTGDNSDYTMACIVDPYKESK